MQDTARGQKHYLPKTLSTFDLSRLFLRMTFVCNRLQVHHFRALFEGETSWPLLMALLHTVLSSAAWSLPPKSQEVAHEL